MLQDGLICANTCTGIELVQCACNVDMANMERVLNRSALQTAHNMMPMLANPSHVSVLILAHTSVHTSVHFECTVQVSYYGYCQCWASLQY